MSCYLKALWSFSEDVKDSVLQSAGWYQDSAGEFDKESDVNLGFQRRKALFAATGSSAAIPKYTADERIFSGRLPTDFDDSWPGILFKLLLINIIFIKI